MRNSNRNFRRPASAANRRGSRCSALRGFRRHIPWAWAGFGQLSRWLLADGRTHISGEWELEITVNSQARSIVKGWECECWESDDDCDYLELSAELSHGWKVARHLMLPKRDGVCLVADALLGDEEADVCWRLSLPLVNGLRVVQRRKRVRQPGATPGRFRWLSMNGAAPAATAVICSSRTESSSMRFAGKVRDCFALCGSISSAGRG